jgi:ribosomal protein S18 acetylase RimI-like enzyme
MHGYRPIDRVVVLERTLAGYRPPMDRKQIQVRRRANFEMLEDPPTCTWWEACTEGAIERTLFQLVDKTSKNVLATAMFWDLEPLASSWGVHAAGLMRLDVIESERRQGLGTVLVAESLRHLQSQGITLVEVQTMESNVMALGLYRKFGFEIVDHGTVYRKQ